MTSPFLINEPPLQVSPTLAREIGLHEAIVLQQIHYWLNLEFSRCLIRGSYWVRYSPTNWERQFAFWGVATLRRAMKNLEKQELITRCWIKNSNKLQICTINYRTLEKVLMPPKPKPKRLSLPPTYDHANFDAINYGEELEGENEEDIEEDNEGDDE